MSNQYTYLETLIELQYANRLLYSQRDVFFLWSFKVCVTVPLATPHPLHCQTTPGMGSDCFFHFYTDSQASHTNTHCYNGAI